MRRIDAVVASVAVLVSLVAAYATGRDAGQLTQVDVAVETVPVTSQALGCPESPPGPRQTGTVSAVTPRHGQQASDGDDLSLLELEDEERSPFDTSERVGAVASRGSESVISSTLVEAVGAFAPGASAAQYVVADSADRRGLEAVRCLVAADTWWFAGVDTSARATSRLVLVNPTPAVAVVSLRFFGPVGPVSAPGAQGIPVGAHTSQVIDLAGYAPGLEVATLNVQATRGQIAPAIHMQRFTATTAQGSDWIPASVAPATEVVVGPTAPGPGGRTLVITNPGGREALVQGRVLDQDGAFNPRRLADVRVEPGRTVAVQLDKVVSRSSAAISLTSNVPVVAGTLTRTTGGTTDLSYASSARPFSGGSTVPLLRGSDVALELTTLRIGGDRVAAAWFDRTGDELGREQVRLTGAATTEWELPDRQSRRTEYLVVTPADDAQVHGVAVISDDSGVTTLPLLAGRLTVTRPAVSPEGP